MANLPKLIHTHQIFFGFQYNGTKEHKPSGWVCSLSISTSLIQSIRNVWLTRRCILHQCVIWSQHSGQCVIIIIPVNNRQQLVCQIADAEPLSFFSNGHWVGNVQRNALCCIAFANTIEGWMVVDDLFPQRNWLRLFSFDDVNDGLKNAIQFDLTLFLTWIQLIELNDTDQWWVQLYVCQQACNHNYPLPNPICITHIFTHRHTPTSTHTLSFALMCCTSMQVKFT